jgi:hypothetical protein
VAHTTSPATAATEATQNPASSLEGSPYETQRRRNISSDLSRPITISSSNTTSSSISLAQEALLSLLHIPEPSASSQEKSQPTNPGRDHGHHGRPRVPLFNASLPLPFLYQLAPRHRISHGDNVAHPLSHPLLYLLPILSTLCDSPKKTTTKMCIYTQ